MRLLLKILRYLSNSIWRFKWVLWYVFVRFWEITKTYNKEDFSIKKVSSLCIIFDYSLPLGKDPCLCSKCIADWPWRDHWPRVTAYIQQKIFYLLSPHTYSEAPNNRSDQIKRVNAFCLFTEIIKVAKSLAFSLN